MNGDEIFEILEKNQDTDGIVKDIMDRAELFYQHTLKYKHVKSKQSTKWVHDIRRYVDEILTLLPNVSTRQFNSSFIKQYGSMEKVYENGMKRVLNEDPNNRVCKNQYDVFDEFPTIDNIIDKPKVEKFLKNNAYTREVKDFINTVDDFQEWSIYSLLEKDNEEE